MATRTEAARLLVYAGRRVRRRSDAGSPTTSAMAKLLATETAQYVVDAAVQIHGARALQRGHLLEHLYREVRAPRIYEGATEVQRSIIAKELYATDPIRSPPPGAVCSAGACRSASSAGRRGTRPSAGTCRERSWPSRGPAARGGRRRRADAVAQDDERGDHLAAVGIGQPDDGALDDIGMGEQRLLDLRAGDVVARRDDHVVVAGLVPEVPVLVLYVGVAGDVPAVLDIELLPLVGEVPAPGRSSDGQPSLRAGCHLTAVHVEHRRHVSGDSSSGRARSDVVTGRCDEDVEHLRRPDAVDDPDSGRVVEGLPGGGGEVLASRHRLRRPRSWSPVPAVTMALYAVGAVNRVVTPRAGRRRRPTRPEWPSR